MEVGLHVQFHGISVGDYTVVLLLEASESAEHDDQLPRFIFKRFCSVLVTS